MQFQWKTAAIGGALGAAMSLIIMFSAVALGLLPVASDARIHSYLMAHPKLAAEMQAVADQQDVDAEHAAAQSAVAKLGMKRFFDPAVAYVTGPASAKNTFVEFFDYNCGHCRNTFPVVQSYYQKHKNDTRFAFIDFPIFGQESTNAARTAVAARAQGDKYIAFHFALMSQGKNAIDRDILLQAAQGTGMDIPKLSADILAPGTDKTLLAAVRLAREAGFQGTPVFIINGKVHIGEINEDDIKDLQKS